LKPEARKRRRNKGKGRKKVLGELEWVCGYKETDGVGSVVTRKQVGWGLWLQGNRLGGVCKYMETGGMGSSYMETKMKWCL
jgi:hypothetical protein